MTEATIQVRVKSITWETESVKSYDLRPIETAELPEFKAGAHIDLHLSDGGGLLRSYSLMNSQNDRHRYVIGVALDRNTRGGSRYVHENLAAGDVVAITPPRNLFPLVESAPYSILIGGGIGITPMVSMAQRLNDIGKPWVLHYAARNRAAAAFLDKLEAFDNVHVHFDDEQGGFFDIRSIVDAAAAGTHLYCCGPSPMMSAFGDATQAIDSGNVHVEHFAPVAETAAEGGFVVELAKTGKTVSVPMGDTILEALRHSGISPQVSCQQGVCGVCETKVLEGIPDHRDSVLSPNERAANDTMMICCSGAKTKKLVLDL